MRFLLLGITVFCTTLSHANDSIGYVGTGGVEYIKNDKVTMYSEDLFISKKMIRVQYQFKNETKKDITENILFPLPMVESYLYQDFADPTSLVKSFKIKVNGQDIQPKIHVRAFLSQMKGQNENTYEHFTDVTENLKKCGLTDAELMNPWQQNLNSAQISQKILACKDQTVVQLVKENLTDDQDALRWHSQVIYSWPQTFKANSFTQVEHQYQPLVGASLGFSMEEGAEATTYCMDNSFKAAVRQQKAERSSYKALSYILTTGANWAKPIQNFKLTIERDPHELMSLCWKGKIKKISPTQFQIVEKNFKPEQDLDIMFLNLKDVY